MKGQQGFVQILILVLILIAGVAGGAYYLGTQKNGLSLAPTVSLSPVTPPPADPMANWVTYRNPSIGLTLKYPENVKELVLSSASITRGSILLLDVIDALGADRADYNEGTYGLLEFLIKENLPTRDLKMVALDLINKDFEGQVQKGPSEINLGGQVGYFFIEPVFGSKGRFIFIPTPGAPMYYLEIFDGTSHDLDSPPEITEKILSTIKFSESK